MTSMLRAVGRTRTMAKERRRVSDKTVASYRLALPLCSLLGVAAAFAVVLAWFPRGGAVWNYPLHQIDAPAHYYFIRKILDEGIGAATRLWPNDAYYPPLFHLLAAGLVQGGRMLGLDVSIYAAFNIVWLAGAGLVWPAGMQAFAGYWTRRVDRHCFGGLSDGCSRLAQMRPFACAMAVIVPLLAVASPCHPYQMLQSGPLVAYGWATSLLPLWLYATLRLFDAIAGRHDIGRWMAATVLSGGLCLLAHPRIAFTWLLVMGPFALLRLPWKLIAAMVGAVVVCAVAFLVYMMSSYRSDRYFDPSSWFHTFVPNRTVPEALRVFVTENLTGLAGVAMACAVAVALAVAVMTIARPRWFVGDGPEPDDGRDDADAGTASHATAAASGLTPRGMRKDAVSLVLALLLNGLVYVCSTALTGWFPNIVAAAWYRAETRPLTMIPLGVLPLLVFAACMVACVGARRRRSVTACVATGDDGAAATDAGPVPSVPRRTIYMPMAAALVMAMVTAGCLLGDDSRARMSDGIRGNFELTDAQPTEQLTRTKYDILADVAETVESDATIISDPLNGSMYGTAAFGLRMLYPIYNPMAEKNGAIFGEVERAFDSGDGATLLDTVCPIGPRTPEYFLTMGPQAESLQMFTFKAQYDPFHKQDLIDQYVADGTLVKVRDYSHVGDYADGWALYRFGCGSPSAR